MSETPKKFSRRELLTLGFGLPVVTGLGYAEYKVGKTIWNRINPPDNHDKYLKLLPEKLPMEVDLMQYSAVSLQWKANNTGSLFSGVVLDPYHILTVGHGVRKDDNTLMPFASCPGAINISGYDSSRRPVQTKANRLVSSHRDSDSLPDVTLIETRLPLFSLPSIPVETATPKIKDEVFFINYQPVSTEEFRHPYATDPKYRLPAIYGGIITGTTPTGDIEVNLGLRNYGYGIPDTVARGGASGGAVVTRNGLIGITKGGSLDSDKVAKVEPITQSMLDTLFKQLETNPDACIRS